jgi:hypothetical protein
MYYLFFIQKNLLWITDLDKNKIGPNMKWDKVINDFDAEYDMYANSFGYPQSANAIEIPEYPMMLLNSISAQTRMPLNTKLSQCR